MSLKDYDWKLGKYNSDQLDLLNEHVKPMLLHADTYDRSVAYLKFSHLNDIGLELLEFADRGGKSRFLIGDPLDYTEFIRVQAAMVQTENPEFIQSLQNQLAYLLSCADFKKDDHLTNVVLQYLVAKRNVEIKLILRAGLHHEKVRIAKDDEGNCIICCGSDNDSTSALTGPNRESGTLVYNWAYPNTDYWDKHGLPSIIDFEVDWNNENDESITIELSDSTLTRILNDWESRNISRENLYKRLTEVEFHKKSDVRRLRPYQEIAIEEWQNNDYKGIMALCTGAGKTFTSISAAKLLSNYWNNEEGESFAIVVSVPYKILAHQWVRELEESFPKVVPCWSDYPNWKLHLESQLFECFGVGSNASTMVVVVVNDTMVGVEFQKVLNRIPKDYMLWIGDEIHNHSSEKYRKIIPESEYILGLSATPWSMGQNEKAEILREIYGEIVAEFGIGDALDNKNKVLVPYNYQLANVQLNYEESEEFSNISSKLAPLVSKEVALLSDEQLKEMRRLIRSRNALLGNCSEKLEWLAKFSKSKKLHHTLIYCAEGKLPSIMDVSGKRALDFIAELFDAHGWDLSKITANESSEQRELILSAMSNKDINAILAIRVLDEGFDLPLCKNAIILSSSRNERQFIQRRGRVLRQHPLKKNATIFDFLVMPHPDFIDEAWAINLIESEAIRAWEFGRFSTNLEEIDFLLADVFSADLSNLSAIKEMVETRSYDNEIIEFIGDEDE